jgi:glycine betaine/choline ABC-type transport system substrate-binding protein
VTALSTNADKKLAVVTVFANDGELHSATVKVGEDSNWLSNPDQFAVVVRKALDALGRP